MGRALTAMSAASAGLESAARVKNAAISFGPPGALISEEQVS